MHPSPVVRVQFQLKSRGVEEGREIVRRVNDGYEEVEVDGFIFKRRRHDPVPVPEPALLAEKLLEVNKENETNELHDIQIPDASLQSGDLKDPIEVQARAEASCGPETPGNLHEEVFPNIGTAAQKALEELPQLLPPVPKVKLVLHSILPRLIQETFPASWSGEQRAEAADSIFESFAAALQEDVENASSMLKQSQGAGEALLEEFGLLPHIVKSCVQPQLVRLKLQHYLQSLRKEERNWLSLIQSYETMYREFGEQLAQNTTLDQRQPEAAPEEDWSFDKKMETQVLLLSGFLNKIQTQANNAEHLCKQLGAEYYQDKFDGLPLLHAPAQLIRNIVSSSAASKYDDTIKLSSDMLDM